MEKRRAYMDISAVSAELGVTAGRVYQLVQQGRIPHVRRGRRILIPVAAWQEFQRRLSEEALANVACSGGPEAA